MLNTLWERLDSRFKCVLAIRLFFWPVMTETSLIKPELRHYSIICFPLKSTAIKLQQQLSGLCLFSDFPNFSSVSNLSRKLQKPPQQISLPLLYILQHTCCGSYLHEAIQIVAVCEKEKDISLLNGEILISQLKTRTKMPGPMTSILMMGIDLGKSSPQKKPKTGHLGKYKGIESGLVT